KHLGDLARHLAQLEARGVSVVAISSDTEERAKQSKEQWGLAGVRLGYGLDLESARTWGLYISAGRGATSTGIEEPALFSEPGLFLVRPDRTLYFASVQTMPFARAHVGDVVEAIDWIVAHDYPARGEVVLNTEAM
ncbi:MAG TPA: hypothetical protein VFE36_14000, partial [Candidatus Baltobacteraceae bacterium]|nr:hypothetical protein [Candidatus Baltobacteraceae bacterium]